MAWYNILDKIFGDTISAADYNQLMENIRVLGGNGVSAPSTDIETLYGLITPYLNEIEIYDLELSNNATDANNDIDINTGQCMDSTRAYIMALTSGLTKQLDASWAAGTNVGGLDTGTKAADTWYYIWLIRKDSDGSIDALFSASKTSPTMPSGYTYKRRIRGAVLTDASSNIIGFYQKGNRFWFNLKQYDYYSTSTGSSRVLVTVSCPPDMIAVINIVASSAGAVYIKVGGTHEDDVTVTNITADLIVSSGSNQAQLVLDILADSSSQVYFRCQVSIGFLTLSTKGFIDDATDY